MNHEPVNVQAQSELRPVSAARYMPKCQIADALGWELDWAAFVHKHSS